jgi:RNA polymerase primary sigma factor
MLYFGIGEDKESTLEEIGKELNLTNERVRQIKDKALVKMRVNVLNSDEFDTYASLIK